jgi:hypothetical protein
MDHVASEVHGSDPPPDANKQSLDSFDLLGQPPIKHQATTKQQDDKEDTSEPQTETSIAESVDTADTLKMEPDELSGSPTQVAAQAPMSPDELSGSATRVTAQAPMPPDELSGSATQVTAQAPMSPDPEFPDEKLFPAQNQQFRLFYDPRRKKLLAEYKEIQYQSPDSHLAALGGVAQDIFEYGRPARVWTAGGVGSAEVGLDPFKISIYGRCDCTYEEADVLLLTEREHAIWSSRNNPPKLVMLRDADFNSRRPAKTTETWLKEQERRAKSQTILADVQRLNRSIDHEAVEKADLQGAINQWRASQDKEKISLENPPMNLLNITDVTPGHWPEGLAKYYPLLVEAIAHTEGMIYEALHVEGNQDAEHGIGKPTVLAYHHSDIQKCTQFRILAQRGACSSWHMDNIGVYTFTVLEGNSNDASEKDEDVVKYWPVFPMEHLNPQQQKEARKEFGDMGIAWRPKPEGGIPVIALTRGDMLIQPPGTIHAPITLTDCFFLGGMAWRKSTFRQSLDIWDYLVKHPICTNEPLPRQTQAILDYIKAAVHDAPEEFGYHESELVEFDEKCNEIYSRVSKCGCIKACSLSTKCSCLARGLRCGKYCHKHSSLHYTTCTDPPPLSPKSVPAKKESTTKRKFKAEECHICQICNATEATRWYKYQEGPGKYCHKCYSRSYGARKKRERLAKAENGETSPQTPTLDSPQPLEENVRSGLKIRFYSGIPKSASHSHSVSSSSLSDLDESMMAGMDEVDVFSV